MKTTNTSNNIECTENISKSPKTPGGITKTLLTPCRRVGLSRRWKQSSKSPFVSPLSRNNDSISSVDLDSTPDSNKRKRRIHEENKLNSDEINNDSDAEKTPIRPKIKKKRSIVKNIEIEQCNINGSPELLRSLIYIEDSTSQTHNSNENITSETTQVNADKECTRTDLKLTESINIETVSEGEPSKLLQKTSKKISKLDNIEQEDNIINNTVESNNIIIETPNTPVITNIPRKKSLKKNSQKKSPNNLTSECIVVLGRTLLKNNNKNTDNNVSSPKSQPLFESDVDDIPLSHVSKLKENKSTEKTKVIIINDDDFIDKSIKSQKLNKFQDKKTSTGDLRKLTVAKKLQKTKEQLSQLSNTSFEDDDDFVETRKNIITKRNCTKTTKPIRAKSTGSITQADIDDLKARINVKKQMLLTRTETKDIKELRVLIKKWRKGCQDALSELMDIMKKKFPDKHNMDLSELLEMLKIPSELVGYDDDHDCFKTPEEVDCLFNVKV